VELTRRNALATSPGFSLLLDIQRPGNGPKSRSCTLGSCGIPSIWRSPTTRQLGGSPRQNWCVGRLALPPGWRVVALQEVEGMPRPDPPDQSQQFLWLVIPEIRPPGEGISWLGAGSLRRSSTALQRWRP
jgi:hypothetical protein